jgi:hypothetical protein
MVGQRIARVDYKSSSNMLQDLSRDTGFHEVEQAVVISAESATVVLEWRINNYDEFLGVTGSLSDAMTASIIDMHNVSDLQPWSSLVGTVVTGFGVATQSSEEGQELPWSIRIDFASKASVVVALGEAQGKIPSYQPDSLVVIFDPEVARLYEVVGASESAWGRKLHL